MYFCFLRNIGVKLFIALSYLIRTTEEVASGMIEWPLPPVLRLKTWNKVDASVNVELVNETDRVTIKVRE